MLASWRRRRNLDRVSRIVGPIAERHGVLRVHLFGSRARGDDRRDSDYDLCILLPDDMSILGLAAFLDDVTGALGCEVDLAYEDRMSEAFLDGIRDDMVLVYEAR